MAELKILDVGCGVHKRPGATGIDCNPRSAADVMHDLNVYPYPLKDNTFDQIWCMDVLEHLSDVIKTMDELWRIGRPGARLFVRVPFFASVDAHIDPTHVRSFTHRSFDYFVENTMFFDKYRYGRSVFRKVSWDYDAEHQRDRSWLFKIIHYFAKRHPALYEARFASLYAFNALSFELEVMKPHI